MIIDRGLRDFDRKGNLPISTSHNIFVSYMLHAQLTDPKH